MSINRRCFIQTLGVVGVTLAVGDKLSAALNKESEIEFSGILYDSTLCVGCQTCEQSCAEANNLTPPTDEMKVGIERKTSEKQRTVVNTYKSPKGDVYAKKQCMHCNEPACVAACLTQAMYKTKEGPVIWRGDKCMGCRYCMVSCPFDIPKFEYYSANPKIEKCTMCYDRIKIGKIPACVENCPAQALIFGKRRDLIKEAQTRIVKNPALYQDTIYGEQEAGGTAFMYLSSIPFNEMGFKMNLQKSSYPELSKGFLYSVPTVFVLWPAILLGIYEATKSNQFNEQENE